MYQCSIPSSHFYNYDKDGFFSEFYERHLMTNGVKRACDLTADQLRMVLTLTLDFMDTGQITSEQIRRLMLSGAKVDRTMLCERVFPQFSHLQEIDLSHTETTDDAVIRVISLNATDHLTRYHLHVCDCKRCDCSRPLILSSILH